MHPQPSRCFTPCHTIDYVWKMETVSHQSTCFHTCPHGPSSSWKDSLKTKLDYGSTPLNLQCPPLHLESTQTLGPGPMSPMPGPMRPAPVSFLVLVCISFPESSSKLLSITSVRPVSSCHRLFAHSFPSTCNAFPADTCTEFKYHLFKKACSDHSI